MTVTEQLRRAIENGPKSRYELARETGIDAATLCRFVHRQGSLSADGIDRLAEVLGMELVARRPSKRKNKGR